MRHINEDVDYSYLNGSVQNIDGDFYAGLSYGQAMIHRTSTEILAKPTDATHHGQHTCWTNTLTLSDCTSGPLFTSRNGNINMLFLLSSCHSI